MKLILKLFLFTLVTVFVSLRDVQCKSLWQCDEKFCCDYLPVCSGIDISFNALNPLSCGDQTSRFYCPLLCNSCPELSSWSQK